MMPADLPQQTLGRLLTAMEASNSTLPLGHRLVIVGQPDARDAPFQALLAPLVLSIMLSVAVEALTFKSVRLAAMARVAAGLSVLSLADFGYPICIKSIIGLIGCIGL